MPACLRHALQHESTQFVSQGLQVRARQLAQVMGAVNIV